VSTGTASAADHIVRICQIQVRDHSSEGRIMEPITMMVCFQLLCNFENVVTCRPVCFEFRVQLRLLVEPSIVGKL